VDPSPDLVAEQLVRDWDGHLDDQDFTPMLNRTEVSVLLNPVAPGGEPRRVIRQLAYNVQEGEFLQMVNDFVPLSLETFSRHEDPPWEENSTEVKWPVSDEARDIFVRRINDDKGSLSVFHPFFSGDVKLVPFASTFASDPKGLFERNLYIRFTHNGEPKGWRRVPPNKADHFANYEVVTGGMNFPPRHPNLLTFDPYVDVNHGLRWNLTFTSPYEEAPVEKIALAVSHAQAYIREKYGLYTLSEIGDNPLDSPSIRWYDHMIGDKRPNGDSVSTPLGPFDADQYPDGYASPISLPCYFSGGALDWHFYKLRCYSPTAYFQYMPSDRYFLDYKRGEFMNPPIFNWFGYDWGRQGVQYGFNTYPGVPHEDKYQDGKFQDYFPYSPTDIHTQQSYACVPAFHDPNDSEFQYIVGAAVKWIMSKWMSSIDANGNLENRDVLNAATRKFQFSWGGKVASWIDSNDNSVHPINYNNSTGEMIPWIGSVGAADEKISLLYKFLYQRPIDLVEPDDNGNPTPLVSEQICPSLQYCTYGSYPSLPEWPPGVGWGMQATFDDQNFQYPVIQNPLNPVTGRDYSIYTCPLTFNPQLLDTFKHVFLTYGSQFRLVVIGMVNALLVAADVGWLCWWTDMVYDFIMQVAKSMGLDPADACDKGFWGPLDTGNEANIPGIPVYEWSRERFLFPIHAMKTAGLLQESGGTISRLGYATTNHIDWSLRDLSTEDSVKTWLTHSKHHFIPMNNTSDIEVFDNPLYSGAGGDAGGDTGGDAGGDTGGDAGGGGAGDSTPTPLSIAEWMQHHYLDTQLSQQGFGGSLIDVWFSVPMIWKILFGYPLEWPGPEVAAHKPNIYYDLSHQTVKEAALAEIVAALQSSHPEYGSTFSLNATHDDVELIPTESLTWEIEYFEDTQTPWNLTAAETWAEAVTVTYNGSSHSSRMLTKVEGKDWAEALANELGGDEWVLTKDADSYDMVFVGTTYTYQTSSISKGSLISEVYGWSSSQVESYADTNQGPFGWMARMKPGVSNA